MVIAGVPAAGWGDPVGLDGRVHDLLGGDHRVQRGPRTLPSRAGNCGGDPALERGA